MFAVSILLFPDGRLPSRFWRWVFRVYCAAFAALLVATAAAIAGALAAHPVRVDENGGLAAVDYPVGWFNAVQGTLIVLILEFAARLQDAVDTDSVRADLTGVVHAALEPTHVSVWLR